MAELDNKSLCGEADEQRKAMLCRSANVYGPADVSQAESYGVHTKQSAADMKYNVGRTYISEQEIQPIGYGSHEVQDLPSLSNESLSKYFSCGIKRDRSGEEGESYQSREQNDNNKRVRGECFRCGGRDHIVLFCTSTERDARKNLSLPKCRACGGRGHENNNCPTLVKVNRCYNCKKEGHFARNCPYDNNNKSRKTQVPVSYNQPPRGYNNHNLNESIEAQLQLYGYSSPEHLYAALRIAAASGSSFNNECRSDKATNPEAYGNNVVSYGSSYQYYYSPPNKNLPTPSAERKFEKCFRCGVSGHWTKNCPQRPIGADPNGCFKCGKFGHKSKDCNVCYNCGVEGHVASSCPEK